jgi:oligoendopeptidase F
VSQTIIPPRSEIKPEYTWNAESVFVSEKAWQAEYDSLAQTLPELERFEKHLGDSAATLADAMDFLDGLWRRVGQVMEYAIMSYYVDTGNPAAAGLLSKAQGLMAKALAATAFVDPELLAIGQGTLRRWMAAEPRLAIYDHYVDDLFRKQAHVRSPEVEALFGLLSDPFSSVEMTASMLTNADFKFEPAMSSDGSQVPFTGGTHSAILMSPDREVRRTAWENYADTFLAFKNTLANNLITSIKQNVFVMQARRHNSTLEAALFAHNLPVEVFHNLVDTFRRNLPVWHRYWRIRRQALGVDRLHPYDIWAPLTDRPPTFTYQEAVDWICRGLAPMGSDYVDVARRACLEERWVDVYPNQGKEAGAFSSGSPGTYPFILMNFTDDLKSLSILAHELGHSMHSHLAWQEQPMVYTPYSLFLAEVASNFHQALVRSYLLEHHTDPGFQVAVIEEAMDVFHRYLFIMPTLARFELETHRRIERGQGLTADDMIELTADLFGEGYGGEVEVDRQREGITWAQFSHLYEDYYVYQYATGISGAQALARRVLGGEPDAVENYLAFLKAGSSLYPLDALKLAGLDLSAPAAVEEAFEVLSGMLDRLEALLE